MLCLFVSDYSSNSEYIKVFFITVQLFIKGLESNSFSIMQVLISFEIMHK